MSTEAECPHSPTCTVSNSEASIILLDGASVHSVPVPPVTQVQKDSGDAFLPASDVEFHSILRTLSQLGYNLTPNTSELVTTLYLYRF
jgi:hypothetical protein